MKIKDLLKRYNLKTRQSIYNWCNALNITLEKDSSGHAYATTSQIELLDQLANHLQQGGKLTNFTPVSNVEIDTTMDNEIDKEIDNQIEPVHSPIDTQLLGEIVTAIASRLQPPDPLWYMSILERALSSNWLLTTSEVKQLIGVKPRTKKGQSTYKRGNWIFMKSGKIGNQTAWRVMKDDLVDNSKV